MSGQRRTPLSRLGGSRLFARVFIAARAPRRDELDLVTSDIDSSIGLPLGLFPGRSSPTEPRDRQSAVSLDACTFRSSTVPSRGVSDCPHIDLRIRPGAALHAGHVSSLNETSRARPRVSRSAQPVFKERGSDATSDDLLTEASLVCQPL